MNFTKDSFISQYNILRSTSNVDKTIQQQANLYLMNFQKSQEAWGISRELLETNDQQVQFMGAHILQMKVKQSFTALSTDQFFELRNFFFALVENRTDLSLPTLVSLCSSLSSLAIVGLGFGNWVTVIEDLIPFMQKGQTQLWVGLTIMQGIKENFSEMILGNNVQSQIINILRKASNSVTDIFNSLLVLEDKQIVKKSLECLQSWADFEIPMLESVQLVQNVILSGQIFPQLVCEVLIVILSHATGVEILAKRQLTGEDVGLDAREMASLEQIIRMINELPVSIYTCDLFVSLMVSFPVLLLGDATMREGLFNILLNFAASEDNKVSACTIKFIDSWIKTIKQYASSPVQREHVEIFPKLLQVYMKRCIKKSITKITRDTKNAVKIIDLETGIESKYVDPKDALGSDDDDSDSDPIDEIKQMSLHEYRECCQEGFYFLFQGVRDFYKAEGIARMYEIVFSLLDQNEKTHEEACFHAEIAIYTATQFVELESVNQSNPNVEKLLRYIVSSMPDSDITIQTAIQFIFEASREIANTPDLFHGILTYLVKQFQNGKVRAQAAQCLISVVEQTETHSHLESLSLLAVVFNEAFSNPQILGFSILQSLIQSILVFSIKLKDQSQREQALVQFLSLIQAYLVAQQLKVTNKTIERQELERTLDILTSVFQGFESMEVKYRSYSSRILGQFCGENIAMINGLFKEFGIQRFNIFFMRFIQLYTFLIKACGPQLPANFCDSINIALEIFQSNPTKYFASLRLLSKLIIEAPKHEGVHKWLQQTYASFNSYILGFFAANASNQDPDLMANYFGICRNMQLHFEDIFLQANFQTTFDFALTSLLAIEDFTMTREILGLLSKVVEKNSTIDFNAVLATVVRATTTLQRTQVAQLAAVIIQSVKKINNDQQSAITIFSSLESVSAAKTQADKEFIAESLLRAAKSGELRNMKKVMSALYALASGLSDMEGYRFELSLMM